MNLLYGFSQMIMRKNFHFLRDKIFMIDDTKHVSSSSDKIANTTYRVTV